MRILQVHPFLKGERINPLAGGKSRVSLMLTRYLVECGHEVALLPWGERIWGAPVSFGVSPGRTVNVFPTMTFPARWKIYSDWNMVRSAGWMEPRGRLVWADMFFLAGLRSAVAKFKPAVIHVHYSHSDIPVLYRLAGLRQPLVLTHHTGRMAADLQSFDRILFISQAMRETICRDSGYPLNHSAVVYLPVADAFRQGTVETVQNREGMIFVGGLSDAKGVDLLLDAYRRNPEWNAYPLHLCGTGAQEQGYRDTAGAHHVNVSFEGRLDAEGVRRLVSRAHFLILPSRSEGFSVAIMEALACGTPVVGWAPQIRELEARWGIRIGVPFDARVQTEEDLAAMIRQALQEEAEHKFNHQEIAARAREECSLERFGQANLKIYEEVRARK